MGRCKECLYWEREHPKSTHGKCKSEKFSWPPSNTPHYLTGKLSDDPNRGATDTLLYDCEAPMIITILQGENFGCIHCEPKGGKDGQH